MTGDPLSNVVDQPLSVDISVLQRLRAFRDRPKVSYLPGVDPALERERLARVLDALADTLIEGIESHPTKLWVMAQFQQSLAQVEQEDTEAREHFGTEVEGIMDILGIESSDGLLARYLGGI